MLVIKIEGSGRMFGRKLLARYLASVAAYTSSLLAK